MIAVCIHADKFESCRIALKENQIAIVQSSLVGSILVNLLLILGSAIFVGGMKYREQEYNGRVTDLSATLLCLSAFSLVIPVSLLNYRVIGNE